MAWAKIDDASSYHPKARRAGLEAWGLYVASIVYSTKLLKDGVIASDALADVWPWGGNLRKLANRLVAAGLWDTADGGGWTIHDYLDHQSSRADVLAARAAESERKRLARGQPSKQRPTGQPPDGARTDMGRRADSGARPEGVPRARAPALLSDSDPTEIRHQSDPDLGGAGFSEHDPEADYTWNRRELEREITAERGKPWSLPANRFGLTQRADAVVEEIRAFAAGEKADPRAVCATAFRSWAARQTASKRGTDPHLWLDDWAGALPDRSAP
jgi:hypothetical protein